MTADGLSSLKPEELAREVLAGGGTVSVEWLLAHAVSVANLREFARVHDITVKGYRPDRAPPDKLASAIAKAEPDIVEKACRLITAGVDASVKAAGPRPDAAVIPVTVHRVVEQARDVAVRRAAKLERQSAVLRGQVDGLRRDLQRAREEQTRLHASERQLRFELGAVHTGVRPEHDSAALRRRVHELERDLETLGEAEEGRRRLLALRETRLREAEAQIAELDALLPKGRRRRKRPPAEPAADPERRFFVPRFEPSFYRSLDGKDRVAVERAFRAVFSLCTEGPAYPGLEVKQIEGQDLWSCRASLKLRVYFRMSGEGTVSVLELADREDQHTALRRLKDR